MRDFFYTLKIIENPFKRGGQVFEAADDTPEKGRTYYVFPGCKG